MAPVREIMSEPMDAVGEREVEAAPLEGGSSHAQGSREQTRGGSEAEASTSRTRTKRVDALLDGVGRIWPLFVGLVVAVAIAGEVQGPQAAAVTLSGGAALCLVLVGLAVRLDRVARGAAVLVAVALGLVMVGILTFGSPAVPRAPQRSPAANATRVTPRHSADLSGSRLRGSDLAGAHLVEADLRGADMRDVCLRGANLRGAVVDGADFGGADLRGATLDGVDTGAARAWPTATAQEQSPACK